MQIAFTADSLRWLSNYHSARFTALTSSTKTANRQPGSIAGLLQALICTHLTSWSICLATVRQQLQRCVSVAGASTWKLSPWKLRVDPVTELFVRLARRNVVASFTGATTSILNVVSSSSMSSIVTWLAGVCRRIFIDKAFN